MSLNIAEVGSQRIDYPNAEKQKFEKLEDYIKIAKRAISHFARGSLAVHMLRSEDAISHVAESMMMADWRFDESKGKTQYAYRNQCAIWAIKDYVSRTKTRANAQKNLSLDQYMHYEDNTKGSKYSFYNLIKNNDMLSPLENLLQKEEKRETRKNIDSLLEKSNLSDSQKKCIKMHYLEELSVVMVGQKLSITRQAVQQNIKRGLDKLRKFVGAKSE